MQDRDREFSDAARVVSESVVARAVIRAVTAVAESIDTSATAAVVRRIRITQVGVIITSACVTHAVLLQLLPDRLAPVKALGYGMVLAFAALVVAIGRITKRSSRTATADNSAGTANTMNS